MVIQRSEVDMGYSKPDLSLLPKRGIFWQLKSESLYLSILYVYFFEVQIR